MNKRQCKKIANRPLTERKIIGDVLFWMLPKEWNHRHMQRYFKRFVAPNTSRTGYWYRITIPLPPPDCA